MKNRVFMLHQLIWDWLKLQCKQMLCTQFIYESFARHTVLLLAHWDKTEILNWPSAVKGRPKRRLSAPFILSPPPCRCWMGGPCGRTTQWESYSSCQVPLCYFLLGSESRHSQPSQMNCCCHSTWTEQSRRKRQLVRVIQLWKKQH